MEMQKLRITAKTRREQRYGVVFMGKKVAVAFNRDSGARVGRDGVRMLSGDIGSGGSRVNWYCWVAAGSVFELEIDAEIYRKNRNRIKEWEMEELAEFTMSKERADEMRHAETNLE